MPSLPTLLLDAVVLRAAESLLEDAVRGCVDLLTRRRPHGDHYTDPPDRDHGPLGRCDEIEELDEDHASDANNIDVHDDDPLLPFGPPDRRPLPCAVCAAPAVARLLRLGTVCRRWRTVLLGCGGGRARTRGCAFERAAAVLAAATRSLRELPPFWLPVDQLASCLLEAEAQGAVEHDDAGGGDAVLCPHAADVAKHLAALHGDGGFLGALRAGRRHGVDERHAAPVTRIPYADVEERSAWLSKLRRGLARINSRTYPIHRHLRRYVWASFVGHTRAGKSTAVQAVVCGDDQGRFSRVRAASLAALLTEWHAHGCADLHDTARPR